MELKATSYFGQCFCKLMLKKTLFHRKRVLAKMAPPSFYAFMHKKRGENKLQLIFPRITPPEGGYSALEQFVPDGVDLRGSLYRRSDSDARCSQRASTKELRRAEGARKIRF